MWALPANGRWDPTRSYRSVARVDLWHKSKLLAADVDFIDGAVTEKWVTGIRGSMDLTVPPTRQWLDWLALDDLELLPFVGISFGRTEFAVPLGVFPVLFPGVDAPAKPIALHVDDHWQYVNSARFMYPIMSYPGQVRAVIGTLLGELGIGAGRLHPITYQSVSVPIVTATNTTELASVLWERSRHDTIVQLVESIGAEAFIDRYGQPQVRDRRSSPGVDLTDGETGSVVSVTSAISWADVINAIAVTSSKNDVEFDPVIATITDVNHPAHLTKIGPRFDSYSSPLILDAAQALQVAQTELAKRSQPARSWSVECVPDPTRMPGDELTLTTRRHGVNRVVVQEVTHPLGKGAQVLKLQAAT
jgi:Putative phage tail protein